MNRTLPFRKRKNDGVPAAGGPDDPMKAIRFSFRFKILTSLIGLIFLFLAVLLYVVRQEATKQVRLITKQTQTRSQKAFSELEQLYQLELQRFARRITHKNRIPAALQEAIDEDDNRILIDAAAYELNLAQIPLAVFRDLAGSPIVTLLDGKTYAGQANIGTDNGDENYLKNPPLYQSVDGRLYMTRLVKLSLFRRPVGFLTIGLQVNDALMARLSNVILAEVGFLLKGHVIGFQSPKLQVMIDDLIRTQSAGHHTRIKEMGHESWLLISEPLSSNPDSNRQNKRILAINISPYLAPIETMDRVFRVAGAIMMVLVVLFGLMLSNSLTSPIKSLVAATQNVAAGDLDSRVQINSRDEFAGLADSFNYMTRGLAIKERYRGILDKVVSPEIAEEMINGKISLGGENRDVTTLFTDIRGFTALSEGMEPQEVIRMLNGFMQFASEAIESHGGVVDKYVGDQIMALFGAPLSGPDDPLRAIQAALKIQSDLDRFNRDRRLNQKAEIAIGTGINSGLAVAGNMGSERRLNYTVLGDSVNIASRLCSKAGPGEILISGATFEAAKDAITAIKKEPIAMKGISKPVTVFQVKQMKGKRTLNSAVLSLLFLLILQFSSPGLMADPGLHFMTGNGKIQLDLGGRFQAGLYLPQSSPSYLIDETRFFPSGRLSLFADLFIGERFYALLETRIDRGEVPSNGSIKIRLEQGFIRYNLIPSKNLFIQLGKFVSPFGAYPSRHDSIADPLIRPPLIHEYRTVICPGLAPPNTEKFVNWKHFPERFRPSGAPIIWGTPYQFGLMLSGDLGRFSFRTALMNSAPSSDPVQWDLDLDQSWRYSFVFRGIIRLNAELKLGFSFNHGPYSLDEIATTLDYGADINDYNQIIWGADLTFAKGKLECRVEFLYDRWQVPNVEKDPVDYSYYIEARYKFLPGFYAAVRWNGIHFNRLPVPGGTERWDFPAHRLQLGLGYRLSRHMEVKLESLWNHSDGPEDPKDNLTAILFIWRF